MPRPQKQAVFTRTPPVTIGPDGRMVLCPAGQKLFDETSSRWNLTAPAEAQLRALCEQMTYLETIDKVLAVEGLVVDDHKGSRKSHPLAVLQKDLRNGVSTGLQRLQANLS